jgi:quinol monooxygenase YgiN
VKAVWIIAAATLVCLAPARAQEAATYLVKYIEVLPAATTQAAILLKRYGEAGRKEEGNLRLEVLRRIDRPNQFAIVEAWKSAKAAEAHASGATAKDTRDKLTPILAATFDERPSTALSVGDVASAQGLPSKAIFVVTHVDVNSAKKDDGAATLKQLAETSRKEAANLRYEAFTQSNRQNHFTLVEVWKNQPALEAHESARHTVDARNALFPMSGALFDQRLYKVY